MPRYEIEEGKFIRVAYGNTGDTGVFLSVYDKRLKYDPEHSVQVNAVSEGIQAGGDGCYLDLQTGTGWTGFGQRVDETMTQWQPTFVAMAHQRNKSQCSPLA